MGVKDQGVQMVRWSVIPRVLIFLFMNEQVLLIKGAPTKKIWPNRYNGLGGHIEKGEDALTAACRELKEESGVDGVQLHLGGTVIIDTQQERGIQMFVFWGDVPAEIKLTVSTEGSLEWVPVNDLERLPLVEDLPYLIRQIEGVRSGNMRLFHARYSYNERDQLVIAESVEPGLLE